MLFSYDILIQTAIFILSFCGLLVAQHINNHKVKNTPLVCPMKMDCHAVVHSDYSRTFGMRNELLGIIYYTFICIAYLPLGPTAHSLPPRDYLAQGLNIFFAFTKVVSFSAFIFSLYLIALQIFVIKKFCSWCIISAIISACIFVLIVI